MDGGDAAMTALHLRHVRPGLQEDKVTATIRPASLPLPLPLARHAKTPREQVPFAILGADLGSQFDASLAQGRAEADAAIREEQRAFKASAERMHARLDIFLRGEDQALSARTGVLVPPPPAPVAAPEPAPEDEERAAAAAEQASTQALARWAPGEDLADEKKAEAAVERFAAIHDALPAAPDEPTAETTPEPAAQTADEAQNS
jgi:hypothetical protein